ncbi:MAG: YidC/Oxa1 family insertase periplasmic-domain containing protein [Gemmataceae bacterium]
MRQHAPNIAVFVVLAAAATGLWLYADKNWIPKPDPAAKTDDKSPPSAPPTADAVTAVAGAGIAHAPPKVVPPPPKAEPKPPAEPPTLIALGGEGFANRVVLTTQGAGVQQVILPAFDEADRLGHEVKEDGKPVPLHLIPGERRVRDAKLKTDFVVPHLQPGRVNDPEQLKRLAEPSYTLFHYASTDDRYPDPHLGTVNWKVVPEATRATDDQHTVVFETTLGEPFFVRIRKTYTLARTDYHVGLKLEISRTDSGGKAPRPFRYQLSGPRGLPVEGEWYTSTTRTALVGYENRGRPRRQYEDAASINVKRGGEALHSGNGENLFHYAAIATPYFASALAVDRSADPKANPWAYVRATSELPPFLPSEEELARIEKEAKAGNPVAVVEMARLRAIMNRPLQELDEITVRCVSESLTPEPGQPVVHSYIIYNGPSKVRLLNLLAKDNAVDSAIVDRYLNDFQLRTITDFQSPTAFGTFANAIYWTDIVVTFTNLMHGGLWAIHKAVEWIPGGSWGYSIIILTVLVRLLLFLPSRKQTAMNLRMVEVQKKLKPELDKLHEKYKDDYRTYNQEKTRLMLKHGMNPFTAMGGCLLLFAQMPIFMGLYFCLQESVFFRLQPFLWVQNLAAPDMTVWWTEGVPLISDPDNRHGTWSFLYLGPYLNVLPLIAVGLMLYQQNKMMPEPTDEQMAAQQRMMKIMMGVMALLFYKVAAGLALYFIVSTGWGIIERQFIPKPKVDVDDMGGGDGGKGGPPTPPKPKGFLGRFKARIQARLEELQKQAAEQSSRQHRNAPPGNRPQPIRNPERRDGKDRKRKK